MRRAGLVAIFVTACATPRLPAMPGGGDPSGWGAVLAAGHAFSPGHAVVDGEHIEGLVEEQGLPILGAIALGLGHRVGPCTVEGELAGSRMGGGVRCDPLEPGETGGTMGLRAGASWLPGVGWESRLGYDLGFRGEELMPFAGMELIYGHYDEDLVLPYFANTPSDGNDPLVPQPRVELERSELRLGLTLGSGARVRRGGPFTFISLSVELPMWRGETRTTARDFLGHQLWEAQVDLRIGVLAGFLF